MPDSLNPETGSGNPDPNVARRRWMAVLARAGAAELAGLLEVWGPAPVYRVLRGPESGLVMVRGRAGGTGAPFNLGEMTVTRCSVHIDREGHPEGLTGHAYVAGRDGARAELAALVDALLQDPAQTAALHAAVVAPLAAAQDTRRRQVAGKAAGTQVKFFAMQTTR
jgi:alpha-D-ribose 1-methylphosphonate 5-triphosphate synthase subunit PhnG